MIIEQLIEDLKDGKPYPYPDELKFIEDKFIEFKTEMNGNLNTDAEINFLSKLKQDVFANANELLKSGNNEEAVKFLTISNIIHSMTYGKQGFDKI